MKKMVLGISVGIGAWLIYGLVTTGEYLRDGIMLAYVVFVTAVIIVEWKREKTTVEATYKGLAGQGPEDIILVQW